MHSTMSGYAEGLMKLNACLLHVLKNNSKIWKKST